MKIIGRIFFLSVLTFILAACSSSRQGYDQLPEGSQFGSGNFAPGSLQEFQQGVGNKVLFETDSSNLTPTAQATLDRQAMWLNQYSQHKVLIQGHADERGTRQYNIALGGRRATAVRAYLISKGVSANRIRTTSYGKERPVAVCNDISCWSQNRRAETALQ